jgi:glycosyltransferase involved in cell wall biosynthesis
MPITAPPKISVIVPFYNVERYIQECIIGLVSQSYPTDACEIIMVDNNSTDRSAEIVKQYPRITLLTEKKQGAYAARNRGLAEANGALIAFTDPDCVPEKDWLQNIAAALSPADVYVILGNCQMAHDTFCLALLQAYERRKLHFVFTSRSPELYYGYTNNMAVRKEIFGRLGAFAERDRGADSMFVRRVVDECSYNVVRYEENVRVRHLEMSGLWQYYHKQFVYGRSNRLWGELINARPLVLKERLRVFRETSQSEGYSLPRAAFLLCPLVAEWSSTQEVGGPPHGACDEKRRRTSSGETI